MEQHIFYISSEILCTFSVELGHLKTWSLLEQTGFQVKTFEFWVQTNSDHQGENLRKCTYSQTQMIWQQGTIVSNSDVKHSNQSQTGRFTEVKSHLRWEFRFKSNFPCVRGGCSCFFVVFLKLWDLSNVFACVWHCLKFGLISFQNVHIQCWFRRACVCRR